MPVAPVPQFIPAPVVDGRHYVRFARRPSSASNRPSSASSLAPEPSSRPQSAKSNRPGQGFDYDGISNMMKSVQLKKTRQWREKSPEVPAKNNDKQKTGVVEAWGDDSKSPWTKAIPTQKAQTDIHNMRRHRSSHFSKFKYPQYYHGSRLASQNYLERNIPQCLRRFPRYAQQPVRQNCNFKSPLSVTSVKGHSVVSESLPRYRGPSSGRSTTLSDTVHDGASVNFNDNASVISGNSQPHNGSYHYVYEGNNCESLNNEARDIDDLYEYENEMNEMNNNVTPRDTPKQADAVVTVDDLGSSSDEEIIEEDFGTKPDTIETTLTAPFQEEAVEVPEDDNKQESAPETPRTGLFKSLLRRQSAPSEESIKSWVDPDNDTDYYNKNTNVMHADQSSDIAESVKSSHTLRSERSNKSSRSKQSKASVSSKRSSNLQFSDADIQDILGDGDSDDPIGDYMNSTKTPRPGTAKQRGSIPSRSSASSPRYEPPRPKTSMRQFGDNISTPDSDDIAEDLASSDNAYDQYAVMDDLVRQHTVQSGGVRRAHINRPMSAVRRKDLQDSDNGGT